MISIAHKNVAGPFGQSSGQLSIRFREFYAELVSIRDAALAADRAADQASQHAAYQGDDTSAAMPVVVSLGPILAFDADQELAVGSIGEDDRRKKHPLVIEVQLKVKALLEGQAAAVSTEASSIELEIYREAQFVMAALADETFLHLGWSGNDAWKRSLLETQLFGSYSASQEFFRRLDNLLDRDDTALADLALIYLLALSLGFRGKHRGDEGAVTIKRYRDCLLGFVKRARPELMESKQVADAQAYRYTVNDPSERWLPSPFRWFLLLGISIGAYFVVQHLMWNDMTAQLDLLLRTIETRVQ
jgi:type VI secretion system protein ImpK